MASMVRTNPRRKVTIRKLDDPQAALTAACIARTIGLRLQMALGFRYSQSGPSQIHWNCRKRGEVRRTARRLLGQARLHLDASIEDLNIKSALGLDRSLVFHLADSEWIRQGHLPSSESIDPPRPRQKRDGRHARGIRSARPHPPPSVVRRGAGVAAVPRRDRAGGERTRVRRSATALRCRRRPGRKPCKGRIEVLRRDIPPEVEWRCPSCARMAVSSRGGGGPTGTSPS